MKKMVKIINKNRVVSSFIIISFSLILIMSVFWISNKGTFSINSEDVSVTFNCPSVVNKGDVVNCDLMLNINNPTTVYSVNANYDFPDGIDSINFSFDDTECSGEGCFELLERTENGFAVVSIDGIDNSSYIGTITFTVPDSYEVNQNFEIALSNIGIIYDEDGEETILTLESALSGNLRVASNESYLASLSIQDVDFDTQFNSLSFNYTATIPAGSDISNVHFDFELVTDAASILINGNEPIDVYTLQFGHNIFELMVTAEDSITTSTYVVDITREYSFNKTDVYPYISEVNTIYVGSDSDDEIAGKLSGDGVVFSVSGYNLYAYAEDNLDGDAVASFKVARYGQEYSIYNNTFYINSEMTFGDLSLDDEHLNVKLYDDSGTLLSDNNTDSDIPIVAGYVLKLYYDSQELAAYTFTDTVLSFGSDLRIDDINNIIYRIPINTTGNDLKLKGMINTSASVIIKDASGTNTIDLTEKLKTGYKLEIVDGDNTISYTLSVMGDLSRDGRLRVNDVSMAYRYVKGKSLQISQYINGLSQAQIYAADMNGNGVVKLNDVSIIYRNIQRNLS